MSNKAAIGCGVFSFVLLIAVILFGSSFKVLEPLEVGLDYNKNWFNVDQSKLYGPGRYLIGLGHGFLRFPINHQIIRFEGAVSSESADDKQIKVRSSDGLQVAVSCSFTYELPQNAQQLYSLYMEFRDEHRKFIGAIARDEIRNAAADFEASQFYTDRRAIATAMASILNVTMFTRWGVHVGSFQLLNFDLPSPYLSAIEATEVWKQGIEEAHHERELMEEKIKTEELANVKRGRRAIVDRRTNGEVTLIEQRGIADALDFQLGALANSTEVTKRLMFDYLREVPVVTSNGTTVMQWEGYDRRDLLAFLWIQSIRTHTHPHLLLDADIPSVLSLS